MRVTFINENADKIEIAALSGVTGSTDSLRALAVIAWTEAKLQVAAGALWETSALMKTQWRPTSVGMSMNGDPL